MSDDNIPQSDALSGAQHPRLTYRIFGHTGAETEFLAAYNTARMHHAWIVSGPKGIGKATLAWKISKFVLANQTDTAMPEESNANSLSIDPNNPIARRIDALSEPNMFLVRRPWDEKTKRLKSAITVDEIRKLKNFFMLSATDGGWRIAIIDAADEMNVAASNALLKILEEPPNKVLLILVCHQSSRLLPTIRSRCRTLRCNKLDPENLQNALAPTEFEVGADARAISILADGSVGESIDLITNNGVEIYQNIVKSISSGARVDRAIALKLANACVGKTAEQTYALTTKLIHYFIARLAKYGAMQPNDFTEAATGEAQILSNLSPNANTARKWANISQELSTRVTHAKAVNLDPSSVILDMFLKIEETAQK